MKIVIFCSLLIVLYYSCTIWVSILDWGINLHDDTRIPWV